MGDRRLRFGEQLELELDWGRQPWSGASPRALAQEIVEARIFRYVRTCGVDKSEVGCPSREALRFGPDPAQFTAYLKGNPNGP